jgi:hypothetical protein
MKRWSKTKKLAESFFDPLLVITIHATVIREPSAEGATGPRALIRFESKRIRKSVFALPLASLSDSEPLHMADFESELRQWIASQPEHYVGALVLAEQAKVGWTSTSGLELLRVFLLLSDRRVGKRRLQQLVGTLPKHFEELVALRLGKV